MTTVALRGPGTLVSSRAVALAPLGLALAGVFLGWIGSSWDVAWHRALERETFWSPPHVFMYVGTSLSGLGALFATVTAMLGRPSRSRELAIGPLRAERAIAVGGLGALVIIASAPFDDLWHNLFGRDVDIWSPPHLAAVVGAVTVYTGWAAAAGAGVFPLPARVRSALVALLAGGVIGTIVFGMNFYYIMGWSREALFYPMVVCATVPFSLALAAALVPWRFGATAAALAYTLTALAMFGALRAFGWLAPAFPPLVVVGALAVDLLRPRANALVLGVAFATAFVLAEGVRLVVFAPPPPSAGLLADRDFGPLVMQYWTQALARPWLSLWPLVAVVLGAPLAAASWAAGRIAARSLSAR